MTRKRQNQSMGGLFENLRSLFAKKKTGLPAYPPAPPKPPAPSIFDVFKPKTGLPARVEKPGPPEKKTIFSALAPKELRPMVEHVPEEFKALAPAPAPEETRVARPAEIFETLFPKEEEEKDIFRGLAPERAMEPVLPPPAFKTSAAWRGWRGEESWRQLYPDIVETTGGQIPLWILHDYGWVMPTTYEVAERTKQILDLTIMFEEILNLVENDWWSREVAEAPHVGENAARYELQFVGRDDLYWLMGIPRDLVREYGYSPLGDDSFWNEVLVPYLLRFTKAMDVLKPRGLRGWFSLELGDGGFWVTYLEAPHRPSFI